MTTKVKDHKDYFISDAEQLQVSWETMNALNELMMKVASIPGVDIYMHERMDPRGFKITIVKG